MKEISVIGLDLAKNVFHVVSCDQRGNRVAKKMLKRHQLLTYFAQLPACLVGMEACATSHYWARALSQCGHEVKLLPPQYVKAFVRGNKNDYNDAQGIAEAVRQPQMRFSPIKTMAQQDIQSLHRMRQHCVEERTALVNQIRGLLAERGLVFHPGINVIKRALPAVLEDGDNHLSQAFRRWLHHSWQRLQQLDQDVDFYTDELKQHSLQDDTCQRLQTIPGFGSIVSAVYASMVGDGSAYRRGRDVSAAIGLVPRQHSSGGKEILLSISKRGDKYLRSLLVHGARSVVIQAAKKHDRLSGWINKIRAKRGFNKAVVALANKLARIGWAVITSKGTYLATEVS